MSHLIIVGSAHTRPFNRATGRTHEEQGAFCLHHYSGDATFPEVSEGGPAVDGVSADDFPLPDSTSNTPSVPSRRSSSQVRNVRTLASR